MNCQCKEHLLITSELFRADIQTQSGENEQLEWRAVPQGCLSRYLSCGHKWPWLQTWHWTASLPWWQQHLSAAQSAVQGWKHVAVTNDNVLGIFYCLEILIWDFLQAQINVPQTLKVLQRNVKLTVMNSPLSQASSLIASKQASSLPDMLTTQWCTSGYWVEEWLPQMITFLTWVAGTPQRIATYRNQVCHQLNSELKCKRSKKESTPESEPCCGPDGWGRRSLL